MEEAVSKAADAVACMVTEGADLAMNRFNTPRKKKQKPAKAAAAEEAAAIEGAAENASAE